jgi:precorrin-8X/cobalt-precorrin-8 methylmutase
MNFMNDPCAIEERSMAIIEENLPELNRLPVEERQIVKRVIHTTGDLSYGGLVRISPGAATAGLAAVRAGRPVITDVNMLKTGLNPGRLEAFGIKVNCYIRDPRVVAEARAQGITRAMAAMRLAVPEMDGGIVAVGNAPTALFVLCELIRRGEVSPALVVGTPVGFVGAAESKEMLMGMPVPHITVPGTKGGSTVAAAVVNALLYMA